LANLQSAYPTSNDGDYAIVDSGTGISAKEYIWDSDEGWVLAGNVSLSTTDALPEGSTNLYFTIARVLASVLTGISFATGGAIVSTDSVLVAFGKIQKQINDALISIELKENIANKQNSLVTDGTGQKYLTVDAAIDGLNTKLDKGTYPGTAQTLKADIDAIYQPDTLISSIAPSRVGNTFTYPAGLVNML